jgi:hypothetical protein
VHVLVGEARRGERASEARERVLPVDVQQAGGDLGERLSDRGPESPHEQHVAAGGDRQDRRGTRMPNDVVIVLEPRPPLAVDREDPTSEHLAGDLGLHGPA